jgi:leucine dehydrogenase
VNDFKAKAVDPKDIYSVQCDIFAPCALGAVINDETIPLLKAKVIAGAANNQLKEPRHGDILHQKGIVYAPDYVINAGGVINVADELYGYNRDRAMKRVENIYRSIEQLIENSQKKNIPTYQAADQLAEERIALMKQSLSQFLRDEQSILSHRRFK